MARKPIGHRHPGSMMCRGCWEVLRLPIFIRGPLAIPYRVAGIGTSSMHPDTCDLCEKRFKGMMKSPQIQQDVTILFADVRNYTSLSTSMEPQEMTRLLGLFYGICADVVWEREGIINKFIGDAVLAIFNFPFRRPDHVMRAVEAAFELQQHCGEVIPIAEDGQDRVINIGVGIHTGETLIGEVGQAVREFTAIGPVVNLASRLQGAAGPGEILITEPVFEAVRDQLASAEERTLELKGIEQPVKAYAVADLARAGDRDLWA